MSVVLTTNSLVGIGNPLAILMGYVHAPRGWNSIFATAPKGLCAFSITDMSEKKYKVSEETLKQTTKCPYDFGCLYGTYKDLCTGKLPSGNTVYIKCKHTRLSCEYCRSFDKVIGMCTCPTRMELYARYGI
jgi:hypothetical protein